MYQDAIKYFKHSEIDAQKFDYFDYADFFQNLDEQALATHPHKRKIVQQFIQKCQAKLQQKQRNKGSWKKFLARVQHFKKYQQQKYEALKFISERYDSKNQQLLFYPKINKSQATQKGRFWKDDDDFIIADEQPIYKPNQSTFQQQ